LNKKIILLQNEEGMSKPQIDAEKTLIQQRIDAKEESALLFDRKKILPAEEQR